MKAPRTPLAELPRHCGELVRVCGWVQELRRAADGTPLLVLRDRSGVAALAFEGEMPELEAAVDASGTVSLADGEALLTGCRVQVAGPAPPPLPIAGDAPLERRLDWRYLDLRRPRNRLIFEVQTTAERALREFCAEHGFLELHSPKLRPTPSQSGDQLFAVDYFGRTAYLAQSPQFYKQMAMAAGLERVLEIGPVFRAQAEATSRHATEFTSIDVEISWIDSHEELLAFDERLLQRVIGAVAERHGRQARERFGVELRVPEAPFPRVPLAEAKRIVAASGWPAGEADEDIDAEGERRLAAHVAREHGHELVFVTDYPERSRPFYHMRCAPGSIETRSFDLLWNGLEIASGAQREHRHERLVAQARERGLRLDILHDYLEFFRYGAPPHGGFGLGLERLTMSMLGIENVREVSFLFRGPDRISP
jgi:aspartyl/asparaginyl-tRNA synthetase